MKLKTFLLLAASLVFSIQANAEVIEGTNDNLYEQSHAADVVPVAPVVPAEPTSKEYIKLKDQGGTYDSNEDVYHPRLSTEGGSVVSEPSGLSSKPVIKKID